MLLIKIRHIAYTTCSTLTDVIYLILNMQCESKDVT